MDLLQILGPAAGPYRQYLEARDAMDSRAGEVAPAWTVIKLETAIAAALDDLADALTLADETGMLAVDVGDAVREPLAAYNQIREGGISTWQDRHVKALAVAHAVRDALNPGTLVRHMTASAVVFNRDRQVLLVHHLRFAAWVFPGGHVDENESPDEAAVREVAEEVGLRMQIVSPSLPDLPGMSAHPSPWMVMELPDPGTPGHTAPHRHIDFLYVGRADGQLVRQEDEVCCSGWFDITALASMPVRAEVPGVAESALRWIDTIAS